jgi:hypothetical protein
VGEGGDPDQRVGGAEVIVEQTEGTPKWVKVVGWIMWVLAVPFLAFDAVLHIASPPFAVEATKQLGISPDILMPLGVVELLLLTLYLVRKTSIWGAIGYTGFLGGAVCVHVISGTPGFFAVMMAVFVWGALICLNPAVAKAVGFGSIVKGT